MTGLTEFNFADVWEAVADRVADREALVFLDRRFTYAEIEARANQLAHYMAAHGVRAGDHVGLYLMNCPEYVEAMLGRVQAAGRSDQRQLPVRAGRTALPARRRRRRRCAVQRRARRAHPRCAGRPAEGLLVVRTSTPTTTMPSRAFSPIATSARGAVTTPTCSTPAAPPACRRAWFGARKTRSSRASAAVIRRAWSEPSISRPRCSIASSTTRSCSSRWLR